MATQIRPAFGRVAAVLAAAGACSGALAEDRTMDGSLNSGSDPFMGMAGTQLMRMAPARYLDDMGALRIGPNPRAVSNAVFAQSGSIPSARGLTDFVWAWGQFLDHDIDLSFDNSGESANIPVPAGDPHFDPFNTGTVELTFNRSGFDPATGTAPGNPRQQMNMISTWIDASNVYGSEDSRAAWLRTGVGGRLKTQTSATGDMLPFNDGTQDNAGGPSTDLFVAGDIRANENVVLSSMHTLFVREHNRLADEFAAANPLASDAEIYAHARKIVGAQMQAITYNEFLPALLGEGALGAYSGYVSTVDASIANEFSTAAYRVGHTMLSSTIHRLDESGNPIADGHLSLQDAFFRPDRLFSEGGIDPILRGLASKEQQEVDARIVDDVRNFLFGPPGAGGLDLASLNIQRGRDHGLGDFNSIRTAFGLAPVSSFSDLTSDAVLQAQLASVYSDVGDLDPWVAMLAEEHVAGASVGETIHAILVDQFTRLRDGDSFFFLNDPDMTGDPALMDELMNLRLSDIILRNTDIGFLPDNVFVIPAPAGAALLAASGLLAMRRRR